MHVVQGGCRVDVAAVDLAEYIKFSAVQAEIAAQSNPVGKGLAVTNN
ncbi:hypothetical protein [Rhodococcus qingshengii]|nr:hypothetical protein [Rhodococcus qingshengii]MBP2526715.1 hypothetical protein [Rhodococcus sp. PvP104]QPG89176.1 hypothetical protein I1G86_25885 [Rhodococcus qingshengii]